jgi:2-oxoglutarate ferredoxin oxidoreductase subunit alpha
MDLSIRVSGAAGQGIETIGGLLTSAFAGMGLHVFTTESYMSRIRGGLNWQDIRIADQELFSGKDTPDFLVVLDPKSLDFLRKQVNEWTLILLSGPPTVGTVAIEFAQEAKALTGEAVMANTVAAGAVFALLGYDAERLHSLLASAFLRKGQDVVDANITCARRGAELAEPYLGAKLPPQGTGAPDFVCSGSEAIGLGAATAGVKFVAAYPMTPSTGVFTYLANAADEFGIVVEQAEDEIAAINMVCGATYAGVPAMTTTSGGGFALMVEGISLAGMLELPAFIMLSQRPGPATGLPTRTGQTELTFAVSGTHGEFARAVYAPGTAKQAYELTRLGLETAHRYQTPVILLIDQFLADMRTNIAPLDRTPRPIDRHLVTHPHVDYLRYAITPDGISPRALPGSSAHVVVDSDEHGEDGHITEDLTVRVQMQDKRLRKLGAMRREALPPEHYGPEKVERLLICWGSTYGPCREAVDLLNQRDITTAMLHFAQVWPLDATAVRAAIAATGARHVTVVEGNATGQFRSLLRGEQALGECDLMPKYDGLPFTGGEIARRVRS